MEKPPNPYTFKLLPEHEQPDYNELAAWSEKTHEVDTPAEMAEEISTPSLRTGDDGSADRENDREKINEIREKIRASNGDGKKRGSEEATKAQNGAIPEGMVSVEYARKLASKASREFDYRRNYYLQRIGDAGVKESLKERSDDLFNRFNAKYYNIRNLHDLHKEDTQYVSRESIEDLEEIYRNAEALNTEIVAAYEKGPRIKLEEDFEKEAGNLEHPNTADNNPQGDAQAIIGELQHMAREVWSHTPQYDSIHDENVSGYGNHLLDKHSEAAIKRAVWQEFSEGIGERAGELMRNHKILGWIPAVGGSLLFQPFAYLARGYYSLKEQYYGNKADHELRSTGAIEKDAKHLRERQILVMGKNGKKYKIISGRAIEEVGVHGEDNTKESKTSLSTQKNNITNLAEQREKKGTSRRRGQEQNPTESFSQSMAKEDPLRPERRNEDAILERPEKGVYAVFDGVGGHKHGDRASQLAKEVISKECDGMPEGLSLEATKKFVLDVLIKANEAIIAEIRADAERGEKKSMASTATLAIIWNGPNGERKLVIGNTGDSRAYLHSNGVLDQLTLDDGYIRQHAKNDAEARKLQKIASTLKDGSEVAGLNGIDDSDRFLLEQYFSTSGEGQNKTHNRDVIFKSLGRKGESPTISVHDFPPDADLLLTSDGIHDNLTDLEIERNAGRQLIDLARRSGRKPDDMSLVFVSGSQHKKANLKKAA
ncbi:serine/threonine-protein phosphatase [bacterium]|nr:serine/threonine-protein phosphatase [bacterium]